METTIEQPAWLLYVKFSHYTFTIAAFRLVKVQWLDGIGLTLEGSHVLLKFGWLVVILFGPCLPILNALSAVLVNVYSILLFGSERKFLDARENVLDANGTQEAGATIPGFGFSTVALFALVLQLSNLLGHGPKPFTSRTVGNLANAGNSSVSYVISMDFYFLRSYGGGDMYEAKP
eukprot:3393894-Amphidinium_carterae.1